MWVAGTARQTLRKSLQVQVGWDMPKRLSSSVQWFPLSPDFIYTHSLLQATLGDSPLPPLSAMPNAKSFPILT